VPTPDPSVEAPAAAGVIAGVTGRSPTQCLTTLDTPKSPTQIVALRRPGLGSVGGHPWVCDLDAPMALVRVLFAGSYRNRASRWDTSGHRCTGASRPGWELP
jgi:hypothetical protein